MTEQAFFTLGEAAKVSGKSKATISNAIKTGRLSVQEKTESGYRIAASELFRAFPPNSPNRSENTLTEQTRTPELNSPNRGLEREIEILKEERERERRQYEDTLADLRRRLDAEGAERMRLTAILTDQRAEADRKASEVPPPAPRIDEDAGRGWRGWFGRGKR